MFTYQTKKRALYYDKVIDIYRKTGYSAERIEKLGIVPVSRHAIREWIANFVSEGGKAAPEEVMRQEAKNDTEEINALKVRIADLEEQLRLEQMRSRLSDKIIDIAEKRYNIQIRKKAGAKQ